VRLPRCACRLADVAWALAVLDERPGKQFLDSFQAESRAQLEAFGGAALARMVWGLATLGQKPKQEWLDRFMGLALRRWVLPVRGCPPARPRRQHGRAQVWCAWAAGRGASAAARQPCHLPARPPAPGDSMGVLKFGVPGQQGAVPARLHCNRVTCLLTQ
jgi:hypothetical protein